MDTLAHIPPSALAEVCQRYRIVELSLFGSHARDDAGPQSDVDILVSFHPDVVMDIDDNERLEHDLYAVFGRPVDLVNERYLRNPFIRYEAMAERKVLYAT